MQRRNDCKRLCFSLGRDERTIARLIARSRKQLEQEGELEPTVAEALFKGRAMSASVVADAHDRQQARWQATSVMAFIEALQDLERLAGQHTASDDDETDVDERIDDDDDWAVDYCNYDVHNGKIVCCRTKH